MKSTAAQHRRHKSSNAYEKYSMAHLALKSCKSSPTQSKARAVIRKYKLQLRQMEFRRLKQLVPSMQHIQEEPSEVSELYEFLS